MKFLQLVAKAYKDAKAQEEKQKRYESWQRQPFTFGMAEELAKTCKALGVKMTVTLADMSKVEFEIAEDPLIKRRSQYTEGF